jgi:hypothetical protein
MFIVYVITIHGMEAKQKKNFILFPSLIPYSYGIYFLGMPMESPLCTDRSFSFFETVVLAAGQSLVARMVK